MTLQSPKRQRCAIYTRKSTEHILSDHQAVVTRVDKIIVKQEAIEIKLLETETNSTNTIPGKRKSNESQSANSNTISVPWTAPAFVAVKGIVHAPSASGPTLTSDARDSLLSAIARARRWIDDITTGKVNSFDDIATKEKKVERHIRLLHRSPLSGHRSCSPSSTEPRPSISRLPNLRNLPRTPGTDNNTCSKSVGSANRHRYRKNCGLRKRSRANGTVGHSLAALRALSNSMTRQLPRNLHFEPGLCGM
jgi:hypothetical protein